MENPEYLLSYRGQSVMRRGFRLPPHDFIVVDARRDPPFYEAVKVNPLVNQVFVNR